MRRARVRSGEVGMLMSWNAERIIPKTSDVIFASRPRRTILLGVFLLIASVRLLAGDSEPLPEMKQGTPASLTSLKRFPQNLGGNFVALFSKKNIAPLLIGGTASGIVAPFDSEIRDRWSVSADSTIVGQIGGVLGGHALVIPTVTGLLIAGNSSKNDRFHSFTYALAQGTAINEGLLVGIKVAVDRTRPDENNDRSFPSGHASTSFMIATIVQRYYGWKAGIIGYSAATFIAASRVRSSRHWASDVTAGATLGYIIGSSVSRRTGISMRMGKITMVPAFDLGHRSIGIRLIPD